MALLSMERVMGCFEPDIFCLSHFFFDAFFFRWMNMLSSSRDSCSGPMDCQIIPGASSRTPGMRSWRVAAVRGRWMRRVMEGKKRMKKKQSSTLRPPEPSPSLLSSLAHFADLDLPLSSCFSL